MSLDPLAPSVFDTLLSTLVARLQIDAFFSDPAKGLPVLAENRMDLLNEIDTGLARLGIVVVVAITQVQPDQVGAWHGAVVVTVTVAGKEIPAINRDASGAQKTAQQTVIKVKSLWDRPWTPDRDVWSPAEFAGFSLTDVDEANAAINWAMQFNFRTMLETVVPVLATEAGAPLVTQNKENLMVSPTSA